MECLVLSPSYAPVAKVPWTRAITMLFENKVEVVEHHDAVVRSVTLELKMPSVVRLVRSVKPKRKAVKFSRENVWARDNYRCQYCSKKISRADITYDHVKPRTQGGKTEWNNIVTCCMACNQKKGGRTPQQAGMKLLSTPVKPKKLPDTMRLCMTYQKGMPMSWKQWMTDIEYWYGTLDQG